MCGEVPVGCYKTDVVVYLAANETSVNINLNVSRDDVVEVRFLEYTVVAPNSGAVTPNLWRLHVHPLLNEEQITNVGGMGFCFSIDNAVVTHHDFNVPRIYAVNGKPRIANLRVDLMDINSAPVTHNGATFYLQLVMRIPDTSIARTMEKDRLDVFSQQGQFTSRAAFVPK